MTRAQQPVEQMNTRGAGGPMIGAKLVYEARVSVPSLSTVFSTALHVQVHALEGEHRLAKLASCLLSFWTSWLPLVAMLTFRLRGFQRFSFVQWTGASFSTMGSQDRWSQQCGLARALGQKETSCMQPTGDMDHSRPLCFSGQVV